MSVVQSHFRLRYSSNDNCRMSAGIAIALMVAATTAVHMGLPQEIAKVITKIMGCHKCLTFWTCLIGITIAGEPLWSALLLSLLAAYASNWFAILLIMINNIYEKVWKKVRK